MCKGACRVVFIGIASTYGVLRHVHHNSHVESTTGESIDRLADGRHGTARGGEEEKRVKIGRNKKMKNVHAKLIENQQNIRNYVKLGLGNL